MQETLLEKIKKIQGICHNEFDETIQLWIDAAKSDLKSVGIVDTFVDNPDDLVSAAVISYVLSFLDIQNSEMHSNSYLYQKDALRHTAEYIEVSNGI